MATKDNNWRIFNWMMIFNDLTLQRCKKIKFLERIIFRKDISVGILGFHDFLCIFENIFK